MDVAMRRAGGNLPCRSCFRLRCGSALGGTVPSRAVRLSDRREGWLFGFDTRGGSMELVALTAGGSSRTAGCACTTDRDRDECPGSV